MTGQDVCAAYIRRACEQSLRRLGTDRIDLYQLHLGALPQVPRRLPAAQCQLLSASCSVAEPAGSALTPGRCPG
ncbi:MAG: aldo/keto reductase [Streptosporangiaceae bacterium]